MNDVTVIKTEQPLCVQSALRIIGDKWTAKILRDISADINTFSTLEKSLECISPRTLSQRLDMLEEEGIVVRQQYCEHPPRYLYVMTDKGMELQEVIVKMAEWGGKYYAKGDQLDAELISAKSDC